MRVTMLLCDAAQEIGGKLYVLGGGWSITGPAPVPHAVAVKIDVPWSEANRKHRFRLSLLTADGEPWMVGGPDGEQPLRMEGEFETGRPPGLVEGADLDFTFVASIGPMELPSGQRFEWRLWIDDVSEGDWSRAFSTRRAT